MIDVDRYQYLLAKNGVSAYLAAMDVSKRIEIHSHHPHDIAERLAGQRNASYVGDAVFGAIDGSVTTLAIVAGAVGANLPASVVIVLGVANLLGDGFSMAAGNYQRVRSDRLHADMARRTEEVHIRESPAGEREEIRQIFAAKGFEPPLLDQVVETITANRERWIETMIREEYGIGSVTQKPFRVAVVTFVAFVAVGLIPLLPFAALSAWAPKQLGLLSFALSSLAFAGIGAWRAKLFHENPWRGALETLTVGGGAALVALAVAELLHDYVGL